MKVDPITHGVVLTAEDDPALGVRTYAVMRTRDGNWVINITNVRPEGEQTTQFALRADSFDNLLATIIEAKANIERYPVTIPECLLNEGSGRYKIQKLRPFDDIGDLYTEATFRVMHVEHGSIISSDGTGYWATDTHYSWDYPVFGADGNITEKPDWATHVAWFNK